MQLAEGPAGPSVGWMQPRWVGWSSACATPQRPDVRHDLDAAFRATAQLGPAPCQAGCSLPGACRALGGLDAAWNAPHPHGPRSRTTWMQLCVRHTTTARGQAQLGCSFGCGRPARPGRVPSWMQLAEGLPGPRWVGCSLACATPPRPHAKLDAARNAPHHHGPRSGTTWMHLSVRPPCSGRPHATGKLDAACRGPAGPSVGWMQLGKRHTTTARGQARPRCSFGRDRLARPGRVQSWMQLAGGLPGSRWVGCSV